VGKITAPFTPDQVRVLTRYQNSGIGHPFTCPNHLGAFWTPILQADPHGWMCPAGCGYRQDWAYAYMADEPWIESQVDALAVWFGRTEKEHDPDQGGHE
jgi:hypothetical protein